MINILATYAQACLKLSFPKKKKNAIKRKVLSYLSIFVSLLVSKLQIAECLMWKMHYWNYLGLITELFLTALVILIHW